jgi:hypothetical protein
MSVNGTARTETVTSRVRALTRLEMSTVSERSYLLTGFDLRGQ